MHHDFLTRLSNCDDLPQFSLFFKSVCVNLDYDTNYSCEFTWEVRMFRLQRSSGSHVLPSSA